MMIPFDENWQGESAMDISRITARGRILYLSVTEDLATFSQGTHTAACPVPEYVSILCAVNQHLIRAADLEPSTRWFALC